MINTYIPKKKMKLNNLRIYNKRINKYNHKGACNGVTKHMKLITFLYDSGKFSNFGANYALYLSALCQMWLLVRIKYCEALKASARGRSREYTDARHFHKLTYLSA